MPWAYLLQKQSESLPLQQLLIVMNTKHTGDRSPHKSAASASPITDCIAQTSCGCLSAAAATKRSSLLPPRRTCRLINLPRAWKHCTLLPPAQLQDRLSLPVPLYAPEGRSQWPPRQDTLRWSPLPAGQNLLLPSKNRGRAWHIRCFMSMSFVLSLSLSSLVLSCLFPSLVL